MDYKSRLQATSSILSEAKRLGASLVGICSVEDLKKAPSFTFAPKMPVADVGSRESDLGLKPGEVFWPEGAKSAIIIAVAHTEDEPQMDWWYGRIDPPGNRLLVRINNQLSGWIEKTHGIKTFPLPYHVEKGGVFLKDGAVLAGLGCIGKNNILVTPEFGPRVRLRAMLLAEDLSSTGPRDFDPCVDCKAPCLNACPQEAFEEQLYSREEMGQELMPGRIGNYSRDRCNVQMNIDNDIAEEKVVLEISEDPIKVIKYCRSCELSCPVGK